VIVASAHKRWIQTSLLAGLLAAALYIPYSLRAPHGPGGGSAPGLAYGVLGFALMLYAGFLSARKRVPTWRIGRTQTWMKGHIWLGLLSVPMIFFHAGFGFGGGALTRLLMGLFVIVIVSGIVGLLLQQFIPRLMMELVPMETIYEQIPQVLDQFRLEADQLIAEVCGPFPGQLEPRAASKGGAARQRPRGERSVRDPVDGAEPLKEFYLRHVRPYLHDELGSGLSLADRLRRRPLFDHARRLLPQAAHETLADLETICEERRQLGIQDRLHRFLHGWLLVHLPLSVALLFLGAVHAVMSLRY
jgi:hypothetical protein